jgi:rhodanese-related sulfurtransferase
MRYEDGDSPPSDVIDRWLALVEELFFKRKLTPDQEAPAIAVHCVAGTMRAKAGFLLCQKGGGNGALVWP